MTQSVGQLERKTQNRIVELFKNLLNYDYLGNWKERAGNRNFDIKIVLTGGAQYKI
jgi:type I restriction enzyme R subunit